MERYDLAIIGSGPAGISAALNAQIRGKSFLLFGRKALSEKMLKSEKISNYPGIPEISGEQLVQQFQSQMEKMQIAVTEETITSIYNMEDYFSLLADNNKIYEAKAVILATGMDNAAQISGEAELLGRGVSYCATCDGNLYRGKTIAVVCNSVPLEQEVNFLAGLAAKVYYLPLMKGSRVAGENVEFLKSGVREIRGEKRVESIVLADGTELPVDGIFFIKNAVPPAVLMNGLQMQDGHVNVDRQMCTNLKGVFAAGDCTGRPYQIAKAVGEGNVAAHAVVTYLDHQGV